MSKNIQNPQEEVDLGKLFQVIGNGFKNLFNAIGNLFKAIFHYFILLLIFLKKNTVILSIATILGGVLGYVLSMDKTTEYKSDMILETNFGSGHQLYSQSDYLNTLIENEDVKTISKIFTISDEEAKTITSFEVIPYEQDKNILKDYDFYMQHTDTIYTKGFTFENFKKRQKDPDFRIQQISVYATNQIIFNKLTKGIVNLIENEHYKKLLRIKNEELDRRQAVLEKNLDEIDSIRKRYDKVALLNAGKETLNGTSINLAEQQNRNNKDIDLFMESNRILALLRNIDNERIKNGVITSVISDFNMGEEENVISSKKWFNYAIYGFVLAVLIILVIKLNRYLSNYEKRIN